MYKEELKERFTPLLQNIADHSCVTDNFIDKDLYRINIATLWANIVLDPADAGLQEGDLEDLYNYLNDELANVLGRDESLKSCFRYLNSKPGDAAMTRARLPKNHRDMLLYFSSIILDPEGHRRWMEENF